MNLKWTKENKHNETEPVQTGGCWGRGVVGWGKRWGKLRGTNFPVQNKQRDKMYSIGNIVNNNVIFLYGYR